MNPFPGLGWARLYGESALLITVSLLVFCLLPKRWLGRTQALRLGQGLLVLSLLIPCGGRLGPAFENRTAPVQIWSGESSRKVSGRAVSVTLPGPQRNRPQALIVGNRGLSFFFLIAALLSLFSFGRSLFQWLGLRRELSRLPRVREIGKVILAASDLHKIPFAARAGGRAFVVLPTEAYADWKLARVYARHELQHHRQGDLWWAYFMSGLRTLFPWHPAVWLWEASLGKFQELACDESLIRQRKVPAFEYGASLLRAAASRPRHFYILAPALFSHRHRVSFLKHRMLSLGEYARRRPGRAGAMVLFAVGGFGLLVSAVMARGCVRDRRVTLEEAWRLAERASRGSAFPIVVNDFVLAQLNRFVGTPNGREWIRESLRRLEEYRPMVEKQIAAFALPPELLALPIMESGYKNLPSFSFSRAESPAPGYRGAGLWMFIPTSAKRFGLLVEPGKDERLEPEKETNAAMRYLSNLYLHFHDWPLAIAAYNAGEREVDRKIREHGTRDAWELVRRKALNEYLSQLMVGLLVMRNPQLVD